MTGPVTNTVSAEAKEFAKRTRRGIAFEEQRITTSAFGPKVTTWIKAASRLGDIVAEGNHSPVRRVQAFEKALAAIGRADPEQKFHRVARGACGRRIMQAALEMLLLSEHPVSGIEGERCVQIVRGEYVINRREATAYPAPVLAFSGHAMARLYERSSQSHNAESVAALLFRLARMTELLLDDPERMRWFVRTELAIPLPHGDAIALAPVRATTDPAYGIPALWPDVRTVLGTGMATREQRLQAARIGALINGIDAGAPVDELHLMRDAVEPIPMRREDHVTVSIKRNRAARIAAQKPRMELSFLTP